MIKEAKEILLDPAKRTVYDRKHKAMLMKKAGKEKMDKRQRDLTESLFAREDAGKKWSTNVTDSEEKAPRRTNGRRETTVTGFSNSSGKCEDH